VGLKGVSTIAQGMESTFKALYKSDVEIDAELETLLLQVYESLRTFLSQAFAGELWDENSLLEQTHPTLTRIKAKLGHHFDSAVLLSSKDLGVDVTRSLFEGEVQTRLDRLSEVIQAGILEDIATTLQMQAEVLSGLAESQNLPGFSAIARAAIAALQKHPDQASEIAQIALADFRQGQAAVLAGDRASGGTVSDALKQWTTNQRRAKDSTGRTSKGAWSKLLGLLSRPTKSPPSLVPESNSFHSIAPTSMAESNDVYRVDAPLSDLADYTEELDAELDLVAIVPAPIPPVSSGKADTPLSSALNGASDRSSLEVDSSDLQLLNHTASDLSIYQHQQHYQNEQFQNSLSQWLGHLQSHQILLSQLRDRVDQLPDVNADSLQKLIRSAIVSSEQLATDATAIEKIAHTSHQIATTQDRLLHQLRDRFTQIQTITIDTVFNQLPPLVQHYIETYDQPVELKLIGTATLINRELATALQKLLSHLIQCSFEDGLEAPEIRFQKGKPEVGCIQIRAYQAGNQTRLEFRDDGQGNEAQRDRILAIVQRNSYLRLGKITVNSEVDRSTTVTLHLPLALITTQLLLCQTERFTYGLFSDQIERVFSSDSGTIQLAEGQRLFCYEQNGQEVAVPLYALSELLSYTSWMANAQSDRQPRNSTSPGTKTILLFQYWGESLALEVDRILEEQELVVRSVGTVSDPTSPVSTPNYVSGFSVLDNGQTFLVLDGLVLLEQSRISQPTASQTQTLTLERISTVKQPATTAILVVDDSMTLRHLLTMTLQNAGYTVFQAQDGFEAIEQLQQHPEIQLVTCDVEMPRLDGFEFLTHCRQSTDLPQIPIVMITSQSNEQHQQFALELGASAYLTKPFVEDTLLEMLNYLLTEKVSV
jgi:chemotaxis protein histidine kinase CheA/ActR/RegA family two-component response regulator